MESLIPLAAGLFCLFFGIFLQRRLARFVGTSTKVHGEIITITVQQHTSHTSVGVTKHKNIYMPIVQYRYDRNYRFESPINARRHRLQPGSELVVLIDPRKPRIAMTETDAKERKIMYRVFQALGALFLLMGIVMMEQETFDIHFDPMLILLLLCIALFLYIKAWPLLDLLHPRGGYYENAVLIDTDEDVTTN